VLWRTVDCLAGYVVSLQPLVEEFWKESR
jgi:hypothetical protein